MRPDFDHDEEYLIAYYRKFHRSNNSSSTIQDITVVAIGAVFFALGYFKVDLTWSVIGFALVAFRALRGIISGARYNRILASIIEKYDEASKTKLIPRESEQGADGDADEPV